MTPAPNTARIECADIILNLYAGPPLRPVAVVSGIRDAQAREPATQDIGLRSVLTLITDRGATVALLLPPGVATRMAAAFHAATPPAVQPVADPFEWAFSTARTRAAE